MPCYPDDRRRRGVEVRSEDELSPGMLVLLVSCQECGREHQMMLLSSGKTEENQFKGAPAGVPFWNVSGKKIYPRSACFYLAIPERRLFRIVDGLDLQAEEEEERRRQRKKERTR